MTGFARCFLVLLLLLDWPGTVCQPVPSCFDSVMEDAVPLAIGYRQEIVKIIAISADENLLAAVHDFDLFANGPSFFLRPTELYAPGGGGQITDLVTPLVE